MENKTMQYVFKCQEKSGEIFTVVLRTKMPTQKILEHYNKDLPSPEREVVKCIFIKEVEKELPVRVTRSDSTYLLWIDCSKVCSNTNELVDFILKETGLWITSGEVYRSGAPFVRVNIACPNARLKDGINRFITGVKKYIEHTK